MFTSIKQKTGILLLVALTCCSAFTALWQNARSYGDAPATDPVTVHEGRILSLKEFLPASGSVGYITAVENDRIFAAERTFSNVEFLGQYVLTQYTLAPIVVRNSPAYPLVVGNFITGKPDQEFLDKNHLLLVRNLGDGLILYRKGEKL
ncbi:MAG: hypothetical protein K0B01_10690 [Syntrophobacterales bacterium]|nr:hypothetical protein [Syntrophobacterales bacterium]